MPWKHRLKKRLHSLLFLRQCTNENQEGCNRNKPGRGSAEKANEEIEKEILQELTEDFLVIPWLDRVEKVTVIED